jgi:hypothetical protein
LKDFSRKRTKSDIPRRAEGNGHGLKPPTPTQPAILHRTRAFSFRLGLTPAQARARGRVLSTPLFRCARPDLSGLAFARPFPPAATINGLAACASRNHSADLRIGAFPATGSLPFCRFVLWPVLLCLRFLLSPSPARFHSGGLTRFLPCGRAAATRPHSLAFS